MAHRLLALVRTMPKPKKQEELLTVKLIRTALLPNGRQETVDYDPNDPAELKEATRIFDELLRDSSRVSDQEFQRLDRFLTAPDAPAKSGEATVTISAAFQTYCEEKARAGAWRDVEHARRYDHGAGVDLLIAIAGDRPIAKVNVEHLRSFKARVMTESTAYATKKQKIQRLRQFLSWAKDEAELTGVSVAVLAVPRNKAAKKHYEPFDNDDLKKLFESEAYRTQSFEKAYEFWFPLLGLYTGARINELAQLRVEDVTELDGVAVIRINEEHDKRTKTRASVRTIPIHPALIDAGLLDYRDTVKDEGWERLFPELTASQSKKNGYGKDPSKSFTAYRRACGVAVQVDRVKVFHSFRTTANSALRFRNVPLERRERLVGHEPEGTNNQSYRPADREQMFPIATLLEDMKQLQFPTSHPTYVASDRHRRERLLAARRRQKRQAGEPADAQALTRSEGRSQPKRLPPS